MTDVSMLQFVFSVLSGLISGVATATGAYYAIKTRLYYIEQAIERGARERDELRREYRAEVDKLHARINAGSRA